MTIKIVQNMTKPDAWFTIKYISTGLPVPLSGCTINFFITDSDGTLINDGHTACTIEGDGSAGICRYVWLAADTVNAGTFCGELEVIYIDTTHEAVYNLYVIQIREAAR
jgi:hypothetical protein